MGYIRKRRRKSIKEIARLQNENRSLLEQLDSLKVLVPVGFENLQQGKDKIQVSYRLRSWSSNQSNTCSKEFTWNKLFGIIAPHLLGECSEYDMNNALEEHISNIIRKSTKKEELYCDITKDSFGQIKVQFKALGLIKISDKKHSGANRTYWTLTPYGDLVITQLIAKPKI